MASKKRLTRHDGLKNCVKRCVLWTKAQAISERSDEENVTIIPHDKNIEYVLNETEYQYCANKTMRYYERVSILDRQSGYANSYVTNCLSYIIKKAKTSCDGR